MVATVNCDQIFLGYFDQKQVRLAHCVFINTVTTTAIIIVIIRASLIIIVVIINTFEGKYEQLLWELTNQPKLNQFSDHHPRHPEKRRKTKTIKRLYKKL